MSVSDMHGHKLCLIVLVASAYLVCGKDNQNEPNPWEEIKKIKNALIIWELFDKSKELNSTIECEIPYVDELIRPYVQNCKALSPTGQFPATSATCNNCGVDVDIQCGLNADGFTRWYPKWSTLHQYPNVTASSDCRLRRPQIILCEKHKQLELKSKFYCPQTQNRCPAYNDKDTFDCFCKSNCRSVTIHGHDDRQPWEIKYGLQVQYCQQETYSYTEDKLQIEYSNNKYNFTCAPGYDVYSAPNALAVKCDNGRLTGDKPKCVRIFDSLIATSPAPQMSTTVLTNRSPATTASSTALKKEKHIENTDNSNNKQSTTVIALSVSFCITCCLVVILVVYIMCAKRQCCRPNADQAAADVALDQLPAAAELRRHVHQLPAGPSSGAHGNAAGGSSVTPGVVNASYLEMLEAYPDYEVVEEQRDSHAYFTLGEPEVYDDIGNTLTRQ